MITHGVYLICEECEEGVWSGNEGEYIDADTQIGIRLFTKDHEGHDLRLFKAKEAISKNYDLHT